MMFSFLFNKRAPVIGAFFIAAVFSFVELDAQSLKQQLSNNKTILCAHRGGMYDEYAENSLKTLEYLERSVGPVMAEVDVRKSKDSTLYLLHDNTLERTTTGNGKIEDASDDYLQSLKL